MKAVLVEKEILVEEVRPTTKISRAEQLVAQEHGQEAAEFVKKHSGEFAESTLLLSSSNIFNIKKIEPFEYTTIANLSKVNSIHRINKFFEAVNEKLDIGGIYIGRAQTITERKRTIYSKYPRPFSDARYFFDFCYKRVMPKIAGFKQLYFMINKGRRRVLSRSEVLGRLCSCGFSIIEEVEINNELYFAVKKKGAPAFDMNPSYGPIFKMKRVGKGGKTIQVYKVRTMHPYSEYLQEYIFSKNDLEEGGKFKDDFRISTLGRIMRKFWIDELPMFINLLKGEMKLVGVRPISRHYLSLYTPELQERRLKFKPGLIPPFYYDMPKSLEEIQQSELNYMDQYEKRPFRTDIKYFFGAIYNILILRARSA